MLLLLILERPQRAECPLSLVDKMSRKTVVTIKQQKSSL